MSSQSEKKTKLKSRLEEILNKIKDVGFLNFKPKSNETHAALWNEMVDKAVKLHKLVNPEHKNYMIENRGVDPNTNPEKFYNHIHPVEDLLAYCEDPNANDELEDKTMGQKFSLEIYSRRWGHSSKIYLTRIENGWIVEDMSDKKRCNKKCEDYLYDGVFDQDYINYPNDLPGYFQYLWEEAKNQGLTFEEVQTAIDLLAEWINLCERNSPAGIFRGYN